MTAVLGGVMCQLGGVRRALDRLKDAAADRDRPALLLVVDAEPVVELAAHLARLEEWREQSGPVAHEDGGVRGIRRMPLEPELVVSAEGRRPASAAAEADRRPEAVDGSGLAAELWLTAQNLSLADRLCLALADRLDTTALTADASWSRHARAHVFR